jgi:cytoskeleton protein RodZ
MSAAAPTLGERLRAAREGKGLSAQKVADQLHLDAWVIEAIESGDYARIGPSVYGKGHLKRYAGVLGLPVAEIMEAYDGRAAPPAAAAAAEPVQAPPPPPMPVGEGPAGSTLAVVGLLALLIAGVFWWRPWQPRVPAQAAPVVAAPQSQPQSQSQPQPQPQEAVSADDAEHPAPSAVEETASERAAAPAPPVRPAAASVSAGGDGDAAAGAGRARLRLRFSAASWVDVRDAEGRRLFAGNGRANSVRTIAGEAPMKVYLGFASGVQLQVNNRVVAIGRQFVAGDVARFEAGADGVLRRDAHPATAASPRPRG